MYVITTKQTRFASALLEHAGERSDREYERELSLKVYCSWQGCPNHCCCPNHCAWFLSVVRYCTTVGAASCFFFVFFVGVRVSFFLCQEATTAYESRSITAVAPSAETSAS